MFNVTFFSQYVGGNTKCYKGPCKFQLHQSELIELSNFSSFSLLSAEQCIATTGIFMPHLGSAQQMGLLCSPQLQCLCQKCQGSFVFVGEPIPEEYSAPCSQMLDILNKENKYLN